jgi:hypothetical protein
MTSEGEPGRTRADDKNFGFQDAPSVAKGKKGEQYGQHFPGQICVPYGTRNL